MDKKINDFFHAPTMMFGDKADGKLTIVTALHLAAAFTNISGCGIYMVDYEKKKVFFMSDNIAKWCGIPPEKADNYDEYVKCVPDNDYKMLIEINEAAFKYLQNLPDDEIIKYSLSYNFHLNKLLMHQYFTPVVVENGVIKIGLFVLAIPSEQESGRIIMRRHGNPDFYEYSRTKKIWEHKDGVVLTDIEQKVLWLSAQGNTVEQIGQETHKSPDTVKTYKKRLFKKLGVSSISEALIYAINNRLL
jgi:DNA-binding CsgD family transcriptional regulator